LLPPNAAPVLTSAAALAMFPAPLLTSTVDLAAVELINVGLRKADAQMRGSMCFLLTALVAFNETTHPLVMASGIVPQLVTICRFTQVRPLPTTQQASSNWNSPHALPGILAARGTRQLPCPDTPDRQHLAGLSTSMPPHRACMWCIQRCMQVTCGT
jgi:hypothetical protein